MPLHRVEIDTQALQAARCSVGFACLSDETNGQTVRFTNRDVEVIKCLADKRCRNRTGYDGMPICTCPVRRKLNGL